MEAYLDPLIKTSAADESISFFGAEMKIECIDQDGDGTSRPALHILLEMFDRVGV